MSGIDHTIKFIKSMNRICKLPTRVASIGLQECLALRIWRGLRSAQNRAPISRRSPRSWPPWPHSSRRQGLIRLDGGPLGLVRKSRISTSKTHYKCVFQVRRSSSSASAGGHPRYGAAAIQCHPFCPTGNALVALNTPCAHAQVSAALSGLARPCTATEKWAATDRERFPPIVWEGRDLRTQNGGGYTVTGPGFAGQTT